jgi:hypothetical protein
MLWFTDLLKHQKSWCSGRDISCIAWKGTNCQLYIHLQCD